jgi:uncharacterized protein YggT (Ycf19 family)
VSVQLAQIVRAIGDFYAVLIIVYTLMSWFPISGTTYEIYAVLASLCEPFVSVFRRFIPAVGGIDFSPWVAILAVQFVIVPVLTTLILAVVR